MIQNSAAANESINNLYNLSLEDLLDLKVTVTTGATGKNISILKSSVAVSVITEGKIARNAPFGLADALKSIPGFYVQESGGQTSNSVGIRGLPASQHFEFISVHEDGLPVNYDRYTSDAIQRYDIGIERIESTRGGTSGILSPNGSAAIVNFITKKGRENEAVIKLTMADYGNVRADFYWGKPLNEDWLLAVSGYQQKGETPRETGFNAEHGGQFRGILTKLFDSGELSFTYKHIDERNSFVLPLPLRIDSGGNLEEIRGFDLSHGNTTSKDNRYTRTLFADGSNLNVNTVDGAYVKADTYTINVDLSLNDVWRVHHASRQVNLSRDFNGIWTGSAGGISIMEASSYLADSIEFGAGYGSVGDFYGINPEARRCFQYVSSRELVCLGDGEINEIGGNGLAQILNALNEPVRRKQLISDSRLTAETENNSLSLGFLYAEIDHQRSLQTSLFLSEVTSKNAQVLDIAAVDGNGIVQAYLSDGGVIKHGQWRGKDDMQVASYSFYINDEFQFNDYLRIDSGLRYENVDYKAKSVLGLADRFIVEGALNDSGQDVDNILANNYATREFGNGEVNQHTSEYSELAWTVGFNYAHSKALATYGRFAHGFQTPRADRISDIVVSGFDTPASEMEYTEFGARYSGKKFTVSTTISHTHFDNYLVGGVGFDSTGSEILNDSEVNVIGLEFGFAWLATQWLSIESHGVVQQSELDSLTSASLQHWEGNRPARMPDQQLRITPTFHIASNLNLFLTYHYVGKRYGANDNIVEFPSCGVLDVGVVYDVSASISIQINGKNVTDEICYNEGNPRATSAENELSYGFARPIVGSTWLASLSYHF